MRELTQDEMLELVCAPEMTDEAEESDFIDGDENSEEIFVNNLITKELS